MAKKKKIPNPFKFGVFRKDFWSPIILTTTREEAERLIKGQPYESACEVRELIDVD